ncbi:MAG: hypothetical protein ACM3X1_05900 [Ignavibacteriales bacterium]
MKRTGKKDLGTKDIKYSLSFFENSEVVPWCKDSRNRAAVWFYRLKRFFISKPDISHTDDEPFT